LAVRPKSETKASHQNSIDEVASAFSVQQAVALSFDTYQRVNVKKQLLKETCVDLDDASAIIKDRDQKTSPKKLTIQSATAPNSVSSTPQVYRKIRAEAIFGLTININIFAFISK
jgi:hypothetical protein